MSDICNEIQLTEYEITSNWRKSCEYCEGNIQLIEIKPYEKAICPKCKTFHGWDDIDANWFGL